MLLIISSCFNAFSQDSTIGKSYTYDKYGVINQYTKNMVLEVDDILKISKRKLNNESIFVININDLSSSDDKYCAGFILLVSLRSYDEFNEQYNYIGDALEISGKGEECLIYKGKCFIKSHYKLDVYLNNQGYNYEDFYDNNLSFSVYFNNMTTEQRGYVPQIPNKIIRIFPIKNNKIEQEKRRKEIQAELIKKAELRKQEELKEQEELKRQKEVKSILSTMNRDSIVEEKVHDYYTNKLFKDSKYWDVLEKPKKEKVDTIVNVLIHVDSLNTNVVSIAGDNIDEELSNLYLKNSKHTYCTINGINYSKYQNSVFYNKRISVETESLEKGVYGVEKKKGKFKYYKTVPNEIQEWCKDNIAKNGFYAIQYINYNGKYTIEFINVTKSVKRMLQGKDPQKRKKIWKTIGSIGGLILSLGIIVASKSL